MTGKRLVDRLKEVDGVSLEYTYGVPTDGTADPTGEYPRRDNWFGSSVSSAARGVKVNGLWMGGSASGLNFDVPLQSPSIYPFNQANETPSGHSFEIDDTPGGERILIKHNSGAGVELKADGSVVVASKSNRIEIVGADHSVVVQGKGDVVYDGDMNLTVNGNYNLKVNGNYNVEVGANHNHSVHGTYITETGDIHSTIVRGNKDVKVYGDTLDFHVGERKMVTKKDLRFITKQDFIVNSKRHVRLTAKEYITGTSGKLTTLSSSGKTVVTGNSGEIGGEGFNFTGYHFGGPKEYTNSEGQSDATFEGYLLGRALESWTSKYAINAEFAYAAKWADAAQASNTAVSDSGPRVTPPSSLAPFSSQPSYDFKYGWSPTSSTYTVTSDWVDVWNKISPFAVRDVMVDEDNVLENKLAKSGYTYYFNWTPDISEIRSKMRTMDGANDISTAPEGQTDGATCISTLLDENRISPKYQLPGPQAPYRQIRTATATPSAKFGYTLLGNPVERRSKTFIPKDRLVANNERVILADPLYNPDKHDAPITSSTKLSRSATVSKFLGAAGSKTSLEFVPLLSDRQNLARQWYLHAMLMDAVASSKQFSDYRLQVTEGYYYPANGIREQYVPSENVFNRYWREPYRAEDGGTTQASILAGGNGVRPTINELKYEGCAVAYTLYNSRGKVDYSGMYDVALYIRDTLYFDQLSLDYDTIRPDRVMGQQLIVVMPKITSNFKAVFQQKVCTYFNRQMFSSTELIEISD